MDDERQGGQQSGPSSATLSMEAQSSVVIGLPSKDGLSMKDAKFYGNTADEIFNQHEQCLRRLLKLRQDYEAGKFHPAPEAPQAEAME